MNSYTNNRFPYESCLPYEIPSSAENVEELNSIVEELEKLHASHKFQHYQFGTDYAAEVWLKLRELNNWLKQKNVMPLETKIRLSKMFADAFFEATQPVLQVRYGALCCSLWKGRRGQEQLLQQHDVIDWLRLIKVVRNLVVLSQCPKRNQTIGGMLEFRSGLYFGELIKHGSPLKIALCMARMFRVTVKSSQEIWNSLMDEIVSYLGPAEPENLLVVEGLCSLIPVADLEHAAVYIDLLLNLRDKVSESLFTQCIIPVLSEYTKTCHRNGLPSLLSYEHLTLASQAILNSWDIPLMSTQSSKYQGSHRGRSNTLNKSVRLLTKSVQNAYNHKAHTIISTAFAKLLIFTIRKDDDRALDLLDSLIYAVTSFCHPSNAGHWSTLITITLTQLTTVFSERIELFHDLSPSQIDRFVLILRPAVFMNLHGHLPFGVASSLDILRHLALWSPELIVPMALSEIYPSLQHGLHQPSRLEASLACLGRLAAPLTQQPQYKIHLTTLLELSLPNLDANDSKRCLLTLEFFQNVASLSLLIDESDSSNIGLAAQILPACVHELEENAKQSDIDEETLAETLKGTSAAYPEILGSYMRRVFELLETTSEPRLGAAAAGSVIRILQASSSAIFDRLLDISLEEISNPQQQNHDAFAQVCGVFIRTDCAKAFPKMYKVLAANIREEIEENQAGTSRIALPRDNTLLRNLSVLNMCLLSSNSQLIVDVADDLRNLLLTLREKTSVGVVYTVANTIHHAISALINYNIVFPKPDGIFFEDSKLNIVKAADPRYRWHSFSQESINVAINIFKDNIKFSQREINKRLESGLNTVQDDDSVTNSLIFIRTTIGAVAKLSENPEISEIRMDILQTLSDVYGKLSKDNVSALKEVLFVAKIWLCDVVYERTGRMDQHQGTLYDYEKRSFSFKGSHKRLFPPAVLARKAFHYHHLRQSIATQHREVDSTSHNLLRGVLVDACFSEYPAVRRNAFSALYTPLKIFSNPDLYKEIYGRVLAQLSELIEAKDFERAQGGMSLLKYRTFGVQIGRNPSLITEYFKVCSSAVNADHSELSTLATFLFFSTLPDVFRLGELNNSSAWIHVEKLMISVIESNMDKLHWREAILKISTLLGICQNPQVPVTSKVFKAFLEGSLGQHPDVRAISAIGVIISSQAALRRGIFGYDMNTLSCFKSDAELDMPPGASRSHDSELLNNDWNGILRNCTFSASKSLKANAYQTATNPLGSQGWALGHSQGICKAAHNSPDLKSMLNETDYHHLKQSLEGVNVKLLERFFDLQKVEPQVDQDQMKAHIALYYGSLISLVALTAQDNKDSAVKIQSIISFNSFRNPSDPTDKNWHRVTSELISGLLLALPIVPQEAQQLILKQALQTLRLVLEYLTPEILGYWLSAISLVLEKVDFRRLKPIMDFLEQMAQPQTVKDHGGVKLSLRMALYTEILIKLRWHYPQVESCADQWLNFNHSLQTTRESAANEISLSSLSALRPQSISDKLTLQGAELESLEKVFDSKEDSNTNNSKRNLSSLYLMLRLLELLGGNACLSILLSHGFPLLLESIPVREDPEVVIFVNNIFTELGGNHFSPENAQILAEFVCETVEASHSTQWHLRIRMLLFVQSFYFHHLMLLSKETRQRIIDLVLDQLRYSQVEVRDLAADTLSGIIRCSPRIEQTKYVEAMSRKFKHLIGSDISLIDRHGAVLGLGALIGAFPYTSPPPLWIPNNLAAIASRSAGDSGIVGKSSKKILSDFKKTRQDSWYIDQKVFTQEQLDNLDGALWKNYFA